MKLKYWVLLLVTVAVTLTIDQLTKRWIVDNLIMYESIQPIPALGEFFRITRSFNTGAAFGLFANAGDIFLLIAVVIVTVILWIYPRIPDSRWLVRIAMGLVAGGALGNAIDRLVYGHVVDFVNLRIPGVFSNVSNLADHAIVGGVLIIMIEGIIRDMRENRAKKAADARSTDDGGDAAPSDQNQ
jgi:signal peptidase II